METVLYFAALLITQKLPQLFPRNNQTLIKLALIGCYCDIK